MKEIAFQDLAQHLQGVLSKQISHEWLQWIIVTKIKHGFDVKFTLILSQYKKLYSQVNFYLEYDINLMFKRSVYQSTIHVVDHAQKHTIELQTKINQEIMNIYQQAQAVVDDFHANYKIKF